MSLIKSKKRVADHGEVFTPRWLVDKMLDLVKGETERSPNRQIRCFCRCYQRIGGQQSALARVFVNAQTAPERLR